MRPKSKAARNGAKAQAEPIGSRQAKYKGFVGTIFAKQLAIPGVPAGYALTFVRPNRYQYPSDEAFDTAFAKYCDLFHISPEQVSPSVNIIIPEEELEFENAANS